MNEKGHNLVSLGQFEDEQVSEISHAKGRQKFLFSFLYSKAQIKPKDFSLRK